MGPDTGATPVTRRDRAAEVRAALVRLVSRQGFHGTSMAAVAKEAGVATGTAYVHYDSKDELVYAAYVEAKRELGQAATAGLDAHDPEARFRQLWFGVLEHLAAHPDRARFLLQVDTSPYAAEAHQRSLTEGDGDDLMAVATSSGIVERLAPLPLLVLFDLALGPVIRLVASGERLDRAQLDELSTSCWRAATREG